VPTERDPKDKHSAKKTLEDSYPNHPHQEIHTFQEGVLSSINFENSLNMSKSPYRQATSKTPMKDRRD
jgi:hypothetical protein